MLPPRFIYPKEVASLRKLKLIIFYWTQKFKPHDCTHQSTNLWSKQTTGKRKSTSDNGNTWSFPFFYLKKCSGESGTVFVDYKTVLRDELNFFFFVMTADFSLRLKLQEQQGKLQFRVRNDWIDSTPFTHPSHEVDIFYPKKCRAHFLSGDRFNIIIGWSENLFH